MAHPREPPKRLPADDYGLCVRIKGRNEHTPELTQLIRHTSETRVAVILVLYSKRHFWSISRGSHTQPSWSYLLYDKIGRCAERSLMAAQARRVMGPPQLWVPFFSVTKNKRHAAAVWPLLQKCANRASVAAPFSNKQKRGHHAVAIYSFLQNLCPRCSVALSF